MMAFNLSQGLEIIILKKFLESVNQNIFLLKGNRLFGFYKCTKNNRKVH